MTGTAGRRGRHIGDRRVRIEIVKPQDFVVRPTRPVRRPPAPAVILVVGFAVLIAFGTIVLVLPISSAAGTWTPIVDALFTATSAVCVTGLVVLDTGTHWSAFGHVFLLGLIQVGGFGFMTGSTLLLFLLIGRRTGLRDRVLVQASTGTSDLGNVGGLVRRVAQFTIISEGIGAILLTVAFLGHGRSAIEATWFGVFHSVSAFNNAGFDLFGNFSSLTGFTADSLLLGTVGVLIVLGGLGFAIVGDVAGKRSWTRLAVETKIVLLTTLAIIGLGTISFGLLEWNNAATLGSLPEAQRPLNALFETTTLRTAGFSSLHTGSLREPTLFIVMAMMFIGGASGSTAGGIKVNTFSVLFVAIVSTARGLPSAEAFGRRIPHLLIYRALSVALLSIAAVFVVALGLELTVQAGFAAILFEAISAVGTVGASTGLTQDLPDLAKLLIAPAMFVGRLGPLTLVLALAARAKPVSHRPAVESMRIG